MANNPSATKRILINKRNRLQNRFYKSTVKTLIKLFFKQVEISKNSTDNENKKIAQKILNSAYSLIDKGCKKIAHIRGPLNPQNSIDRYLGYKKALESNGIPFDSKLVYTCEKVNFEEGLEFTKQLFEEHPDVDGIFAITDLVAVGALAYCNDKKINVPKDVKVIGFSNWFMSQVITPKLSTVEQPSHEMGIAAFNLLLEGFGASGFIIYPFGSIKMNLHLSGV